MELLGRNCCDRINDLLRQAQHSICLASFIASPPNKRHKAEYIQLWQTLKNKQDQGLNCRLLIDHGHWRDLPHAAAAKMRSAAQSIGAELRLYKGHGTMHAKMIIIDDTAAYIGSHNLTQNSLCNNMDIGIITVNYPLILEASKLYEIMWSHGKICGL